MIKQTNEFISQNCIREPPGNDKETMLRGWHAFIEVSLLFAALHLQFLMHCESDGKRMARKKKWHAKEKHNSHKRYLSCIRTHAKRGEIVTNTLGAHIVYRTDFRLHYSFHAFVSFGLFSHFRLPSAHWVYVIHCKRPFFYLPFARIGATFFDMCAVVRLL